MNRICLIITLFCSIFLALNSCNKFDSDSFELSDYRCIKLDTITFSHSMKGWELYSWPISTGWKYSLMVGTNAAKTFDQVVNNKISVAGEDSIKVLLSKLPINEEIVWLGKSWIQRSWESGYTGQLNLPNRTIQIDIKEFCDNHSLRLTIIE
jgi:hypothetical protein